MKKLTDTSDHYVDALKYALSAMPKRKPKRDWGLVFLWVLVFLFILFFFTACAPKEGETKCGVPNQYQCVNLCDGLFVKRQSNWNRYFSNELDCNVERNPVFEEYE